MAVVVAAALEPTVLPDAAAVAERVAELLIMELLQGAAQPLGLATGRTMEPVYGALARRFNALGAADQSRLRREWLSFNLDEYVGLPAGDPHAFAAFMATHLVGPLGLGAGRVLLPDGLAADPAAEARSYAARLAAAGGLGLQLLGLGLNGHVGFNEPPCSAEAACRCVELSASTRAANASAFGGDPAAVPGQAITLGLVEILQARQLLLVVTGAAKGPVLRRLLQEPPHADLPASWLRGHGAVTLLVDGPAASAAAAAASADAASAGQAGQ